MEFVILGLLLTKPMTGYEISNFIKINLSLICSHSAGSVQNAIKKLIASGYIDFVETIEKGKNKKTFSITDSGREAFSNWISKPMQPEKSKKMELSKLFFLGFATKEEQIDSIKKYIDEIQTLLISFQAVKETISSAKEQSSNPNFIFNEYTLDYGLESAKFEVYWYTKLLKELEG